MRLLVITCFGLFTSLNTFSQAASYSDPAAAYLKVMLEKGSEGTYQQIGTFKVTGTSFLYGEKLTGNVYARTEKAEQTKLSYNTYSQKLDVYNNNAELPISLGVEEVDSFIIMKSGFVKDNLSFYSSSIIDSKFKSCFLQLVDAGKRFNLFKAYNSILDIVSTNYIQSDLRQFTLQYDYCYYDKNTNTLKKIKLNRKKIIEEFKSVANLEDLLENENLNNNSENTLISIFQILNKQ